MVHVNTLRKVSKYRAERLTRYIVKNARYRRVSIALYICGRKGELRVFFIFSQRYRTRLPHSDLESKMTRTGYGDGNAGDLENDSQAEESHLCNSM